MSESSFTLRELFSLPAKNSLEGSPKARSNIEAEITAGSTGIDLKGAVAGLGPKIDRLFDMDLSDILFAGWEKSREIKKVLEESRASPKETFYVELAKHSVVSEQHPYIEMRVGGLPPKKIVELTIAISMTLKAFELMIRGGAIREIATGHCDAEGTVEYKGFV